MQMLNQNKQILFYICQRSLFIFKKASKIHKNC